MVHKLDNWFISASVSLQKTTEAQPPKIRIVPGLSATNVLAIKSPEAPVTSQTLSAYYYSNTSKPIEINEWVNPFTLKLRENVAPSFLGQDNFYWQPAADSYKQLVSYQDNSSIFDATLSTLGAPKESGIESILLNFQKIPVDLFGGIYLNWQAIPDPIYVEFGDFDATLISQDNPISHQFIKEQAALLQELWVRVPWWSFVIAVSLGVLPWLALPLSRHPVILSIFIAAISLSGSFLFVVYQSIWVPIWGPLIMVLLASVWNRNRNQLKQRINLLQKAHRLVAGNWVKSLIDDSKPETAYRFLQEQKQTLAYAPLWLEVANGYQRNRQLDKAQMCYQEILAFDPTCHEAKKGLKQLNDVIDGSKTMVIGQSRSELPVGHIDNLSLGRYNITRELGRGAMGIVYEAVDPKINRNVALKVVHLKSLGFDEMDSVKQRFFREAQAAGKLNHPNIVTVYDVGEEHDVAYIAMDLLIGKPLSTHISKATSIDITQSVNWVAQAADALGYAHEHEVIHRDVKPANMIIDNKTMQLKLTDFGVARIAGAQQTQTGIVLGSPSYMSPEQIRGEKLTGQTDVFSLGVTLYQALTQQLPFTGDTLPSLAYAITQGKQASPRAINKEVPVSLVRIVNKALQKDLVDRYQNAIELSQALKKWLADQAK